jgi:hypothetical protein
MMPKDKGGRNIKKPKKVQPKAAPKVETMQVLPVKAVKS